MLYPPNQHLARRLKNAVTEMANQWTFSRFVTLQFNDLRNRRLGNDVPRAIRQALRDFDARVNHSLLKKHWMNHPDRIFALWAPEKISVSPHWHGMVRFYAETETRRAELEARFDAIAAVQWFRVAPGGSCDVKPVDGQNGALRYLAKELPYGVSYDHLVVPDEFWLR
jgi:hypothetical protein